MFEKITSFWNDHKKDIIFICIIIVLIIICVLSINTCNKEKQRADDGDHNLIALTDTIDYYKGKNGQLVAETAILKGDKETLEIVNKELLNDLTNMKLKNFEQAIKIKGLIEGVQKDTVWKVSTDTILPELTKGFCFKDQYRLLQGSVYTTTNDLGLAIDKDLVYFDYTIAIEEGTAYVTSSNPYVVFDSIVGVTLPEPKKQHWGFTVNLGVGVQYGFIYNKIDIGPQLGVGFSYIF